MKTAVEWLVYEANKRQCWVDANKMHYLITEAKELEKQQIVEAFNGGYNTPHGEKCAQSGEDYYIETYK